MPITTKPFYHKSCETYVMRKNIVTDFTQGKVVCKNYTDAFKNAGKSRTKHIAELQE